MSDKDILYNILSREIDNLLSVNPSLAFFSGPIKKWVFNYIDPYVNFFMEGDRLQTDIATAFVQEEMGNKIKDFKKKYEEAVKNESQN